jgi:nicotinamide mononucleotide (NMN) deamidase PncC
VSSREVTESCLKRIVLLNPKLNAFMAIEAEEALKAADAADAALAKGGAKGPLHGVPLAHKDMYYDKGKVVTCGSKIRKDFIATTTSTALQRLKDAGTVRLGSLQMVEFAYGPTGHNPHYGPVRNPWNTDHITGGSSSGSGSAVGARADMSLCSLLGGMALANAKLGAVHGLAGVVGGTAEVPHGMACAALLAPVIEANVRALRSGRTREGGPPAADVLDRYTEAARLLTGHPAASIEDGLAWIRETLTLLHAPGLAAFGLGPQQADDIAAQALVSSSMKGNPVPLTRADLTAILLQSL